MKLKLTNFFASASLYAAICCLPQVLFSQHVPIALHPDNPHYFLYHNKPTVLITSGEHYGAVLNLDFNYITYLDELQSKKLNLTRTFTGAYVEPQGSFSISNNTLAPGKGKFICPWPHSKESGYRGGGNKFDLSRWNETYFKRLKDFVSAAQKRGIIVELALFCPFYDSTQWVLSPMNAINNINGHGNISSKDVYTLDKHGGLLAVQEELVKKIVNELKDFDNLMYEICNEPYFGGVTMEWQHHIASLIRDSEKNFGTKHLITQNIANGHAKIERPHPAVSVFNFHYARPPVTISMNYGLNKVIGDNETGFRGNSDSTYRAEGWEFILAGGGLYNNLDYSFSVGHEKGTYAYPAKQPGGGSAALREQLSYLQDFISGFDFIHMKPDSTSITGGLTQNTSAYVLSEPGKQYAIYIRGSTQVNLEMMLPPGDYDVEWKNTLTGKIEKKEMLRHGGGKSILNSPVYAEDIAVRVVKERE